MSSDIEKIHELLDCPICLEKFDFDNKVLPCQHTFCKNCLMKMMSDTADRLSCPECRSVYVGQVDSLPSNLLLTRILSKFQEMRNVAHSTKGLKNSIESAAEDRIPVTVSSGNSNRLVLKASRKLDNSLRPRLTAIRRLPRILE